jgi:hypothetical protein
MRFWSDQGFVPARTNKDYTFIILFPNFKFIFPTVVWSSVSAKDFGGRAKRARRFTFVMNWLFEPAQKANSSQKWIGVAAHISTYITYTRLHILSYYQYHISKFFLFVRKQISSQKWIVVPCPYLHVYYITTCYIYYHIITIIFLSFSYSSESKYPNKSGSSSYAHIFMYITYSMLHILSYYQCLINMYVFLFPYHPYSLPLFQSFRLGFELAMRTRRL